MQQIPGIHGRPNFSSISERMMYPAPPITRDRVSFPPGTIRGIVIDGDELEYLSDHDITAGRIPNSTNTSPKKKEKLQLINNETQRYIVTELSMSAACTKAPNISVWNMNPKRNHIQKKRMVQ